MKAYKVTADWCGFAVVVFAEDARTARNMGVGAEGLGDVDFIDLRATREPSFDQFAETELIPMSVYLKAGWRWGCAGCMDFVSEDDPHTINEADTDVWHKGCE